MKKRPGATAPDRGHELDLIFMTSVLKRIDQVFHVLDEILNRILVLFVERLQIHDAIFQTRFRRGLKADRMSLCRRIVRLET